MTSVVSRLAISPDSEHLVTGGRSGNVRLWDLGRGELPRVLQTGGPSIQALAFSPDGKQLAVGQDRRVKVWNVAYGEIRHDLTGRESVQALVFSADGKQLAVAGSDRVVSWWALSSGQEIRTPPAQGDPYLAVVFSPDERWLATGSRNSGQATIWNSVTGEPITTCQGLELDLLWLAFSRDGTQLGGGLGDKTVRVWEVTSGRLRHSMPGATTSTVTGTFSADGQRLAVVALAWRVASMAFSSNDHYLVVAYRDVLVKSWKGTPPKQTNTKKF